MKAKAKAIKAIDKRGALLVYPVNNRPAPLSLWSELYPRSKMRWEWDADGDNRVAQLWHLRSQLSTSRQVVYAKWYQGRATFFSLEVFAQLLAFMGSHGLAQSTLLPPKSREILNVLLSDSPLSTKQLKVAVELEGRLNEPTYNRALKVLWERMLIVGFGEFEDSSFPSLGIGAAATLFEDLWLEGESYREEQALGLLREKWGEENPLFKFASKIKHRNLSPSQT